MKNSLIGYLPKHAFAMAKKKAVSEAKSAQDSPQFLSLEQIAKTLQDCTRCKLCKGRKNVVMGEGNPHPQLMFIGEGPGKSDDLQGRPFVGEAGQLLDKMIGAMGLKREDVFIANVVKCRPPQNRAPEPDEVAECIPFLKAQIRLLQPKVIIALGDIAAKNLLKTEDIIGNAKLIATFHPAYLLRNPAAKKGCWEDLKLALRELS